MDVRNRPFGPLLPGGLGRLVCCLMALVCWFAPARLGAVGDASTSFQLFVPANNDAVGRDVAVIVTNVSPFDATVDVVDDAADGDTDDSAAGVVLQRGQSWVRFIKDGAINDDAGGKWDGDYFLISSSHPVVVQMATRSDWQWDFAPADNKTMRGQSFFLFSPATSFSQRDLNVVAYEDDTEVQVLDVTVSPLQGSGVTTVSLAAPKEILKAVLNEGQDLIGRQSLGIDIFDPGRTYWIRASKAVTCQYGSLVGNARDGGGFVPSENGSASGSKFYFYIPRDFSDEREVRVVSFDDGNDVLFSGWNRATRTWVTIQSYPLNRFGHGDWVESGTDYPMYRLTCSPGKKVSVFAASWLEAKGLSGTKDIASFASSEIGYGAGREFLVYLPQPGVQGNLRWMPGSQRLGDASLLYLFGHVDGTAITVVDGDTGGDLFRRTLTIGRGGYAPIRVSPSQFNAMNRPANGLRPYLRVTASHLVTTMVSNHNDNWMTFAPSVVLPNPILTVSATSNEAVVGDEPCLQIVADNEGAGALSNGRLVVALDAASEYVSSAFGDVTLGTPTIAVDSRTGAQSLTWQGFTIPTNGVLSGTVCVRIRSRRADGSVVRNRDFLSFAVIASGDGFGVPVEVGGFAERFTAQSSVALTVDDSAQTSVNGLAAAPSGRSINVTWLTGREPDLQGFRVYRSTSGDGPFTALNTTLINPLGDAVTGASYRYQDVPPTAGAVYYYRLEMVAQGGGSSFYGPVAVLAEDRTPPPAPVIESVTVGDGTVALGIRGSNVDGDLRGYLVFRSSSENGVYTRLNEIPVLPGSVYTDTTVGNGQTYFYRARSIDTNGNSSELGASATAVLPQQVAHVYTLAYEDQIGPGKNDWDYNDWVVSLDTTEDFQAGGVQRVSMQFESLARGARYTNAFRLRYRANGPWTMTISTHEDRLSTGTLSLQTLSGTGLIDEQLFRDTAEALPPALGDSFTNTLNRQNPARLGQVVRIAITLANPSANPSNARHRAPFDPYLVNQIGEVHQRREGFPDSTEVVTFWPDSPLLGYHLEYVLVVPGREWFWPLENQKIWDAYPGVFADHVLTGGVSAADWWAAGNRVSRWTYNWYPFQAEGKSLRRGVDEKDSILPTPPIVAALGANTAVPPKAFRYDGVGWPADSIVLSGVNSTVTVWDADGVVREGWPISVNSFRAAPAVGRLTADDVAPVLITAEESYEDDATVSAWDLGSSITLRWEVRVGSAVKTAPIIADLNGDGSSEVILLTTKAELVVLRADGSHYPGSPKALGTPVWNDKNILAAGAPVLVDLEGNGALELFVVGPGCIDLYGLDSNLENLKGWPRRLGGPTVGGLTAAYSRTAGDFAVYTATAGGQLLGYDRFGRLLAGFPLSLGGNVTTPVVAFSEFGDLTDTLTVATTDGVLHLVGTDGAVRPGWPRVIGDEVLAPAVVGDVDGDAEMEIVIPTAGGRVLTYKMDGSLVVESCFQVPGSIQSSPLLTDTDDDARVEISVVTARGEWYRSEGVGQTPLPLSRAIGWGGVGGGAASNSPTEPWLFSAPNPFVTRRGDLLEVLLGIVNSKETGLDYDANVDGVVDAADLTGLGD